MTSTVPGLRSWAVYTPLHPIVAAFCLSFTATFYSPALPMFLTRHNYISEDERSVSVHLASSPCNVYIFPQTKVKRIVISSFSARWFFSPYFIPRLREFVLRIVLLVIHLRLLLSVSAVRLRVHRYAFCIFFNTSRCCTTTCAIPSIFPQAVLLRCDICMHDRSLVGLWIP